MAIEIKVPRLGEKAFEQAAGFLRLRGATDPLDESAVHPESYPVVDRMERRGFSRMWAALLIFMGFICTAGVTLYFAVPAIVSQTEEISAQVTEYIPSPGNESRAKRSITRMLNNAKAPPYVRLAVERTGQSSPLLLTVRKSEQQDLGLNFADPTFDGIKRCNNHCPFCFVDQNAPALRNTLDIKDDDFRYSAMYGNFVTLTNLAEDDWRRIDEQRLSPLYVSVHATEPTLRRRLLGNPTR